MCPRTSTNSLDAAAFSRLLERLHADPEAAGHGYEDLRRSLRRFFDGRGVSPADDAADEALDRLGRKLVEGAEVNDVRAYVLGIARLVALERHRLPEVRHAAIDDSLGQRLAAPPPAAPEDPRLPCFDGCLGSLAADQRSFIVAYYAASGRARIDARATLAQTLAVTPNALRLRAQRLRDRIDGCIRQCLAAPAARAGGRQP
jgi:DNA-directed RNA polymerase specialized sigma24 family protein